MANKITNKKALEYVLSNYQETLPEEIREKLAAMVEALNSKTTSGNRKLTKTQEENAILREKIMIFLSENPNLLVTCTDIGKKVPELDGMNNQKISALMRALEKAGEVDKISEKGRSLFQLAKVAGATEVVEEDGE